MTTNNRLAERRNHNYPGRTENTPTGEAAIEFQQGRDCPIQPGWLHRLGMLFRSLTLTPRTAAVKLVAVDLATLDLAALHVVAGARSYGDDGCSGSRLAVSFGSEFFRFWLGSPGA